ncbi:MAG: hypothetical protein H0X65_13575 [Gemmatimonadetes bacterium]|nr:hypothetical protein [Gemmatimonadota bacterium]
MDEVLDITLDLAETLDRLGVPYLVSGSLASSLHGIPRATQDVDLVASLRPEHVAPLVAALEGEFYLDAPAIREAVRQQASFNVIHLETMFKADIFVAGDDAVTREEMARRQRFMIYEEPRRELVVASPEDIVIQKLHWFRLGDEASERQWNDALGVIKVQGPQLDRGYLDRIARLMGVEHLLERAWRQTPKE